MKCPSATWLCLRDQTHLEGSVSLALILIMVKCSTPRDGRLGRQRYWRWNECGNWAFWPAGGRKRYLLHVEKGSEAHWVAAVEGRTSIGWGRRGGMAD